MRKANYFGSFIVALTIMTCNFTSVEKITAQTIPTAQNLIYSYGFENLSATSTTYPSGIYGWKVGSSSSTTFKTNAPTADVIMTASSNASLANGGVHNYNGKIGILASGSMDPAIVLSIKTNGFKEINVTFDVMTIRNPYDASNTRINNMELQYRVGATNGTFTSVAGSIYRNNTTKQITTVTTPQNLKTVSLKLPVECDNVDVLQLRWVQRDSIGGGARPSFAIDNICITGISSIVSDGVLSGCNNAPVNLTAINGDSWLWNTGEKSQTIKATKSLKYSVVTTKGTTCKSNSELLQVNVNPYNMEEIILAESNGTVSSSTAVADHELADGFDYDSLKMSGTAVIRNTSPSSGYEGASGDANIMFGLTSPSSFEIERINTSSYKDVKLSFGIMKSTLASTGSELSLEVSADGINYTPLLIDELPTESGTAYVWYYRNIQQILPKGENIRIRFLSNDMNTLFRIDDIQLKGKVVEQKNKTVFEESVGSVSSSIDIIDYELANGFDNDSLFMDGSAVVRSTSPSAGYDGASGGANVMLGLTQPSTFEISKINVSTYSNLKLSFGIMKSTLASDGSELIVEVSTDGVNYSKLTFEPLSTGSGTAYVWNYRVIEQIIPKGKNVHIRFKSNDQATLFRIDDLKLTGNTIESIITVSGSEFCAGKLVQLVAKDASTYLWNTGANTKTLNVNQSGIYSVTIMDEYGCEGSEYVEIIL